MGVQPSQDFFQNFEVDMDQNLQNSPKLAQITKILKKILKTNIFFKIGSNHENREEH